MNDNEIRQQMGFDAQQALDELAKLDTAFGSFGSQLAATVIRIGYFNSNAGKVVAALKQMSSQADLTAASFAKLGGLTPAAGGTSGGAMAGQMAQAAQATAAFHGTAAAANQAGQAINNAANGAANSVRAANQHTKDFTISWQTLARVVMTQAIVRALSTIRDAIQDAYQGYMAFSKQVGGIRAIDPDRSFGQIAKDVHEMSDAFNQPLDRTAEAQYQVISDQFTTAADRANILTAANQLAKVSTQDLVASAQLLTGALNAYGESSDMAATRAAQFDKTIELGRLRMEELGTALGRIQTLGHELGVSLEELQAGLVSITIGGVKATEAATQLRGVMTGLLKPTEGMKGAFAQLGVESGEAAIATYGFQGTLAKLMELSHGSATAMATLFPNVRGLAGVLRLAAEGAQKYQEAMQKLAQVDQNTLTMKFSEFISSDAEKFSAQINRISNFFKVEFGADLVKSLRGIIDLVGGSEGVVGVLRLVSHEITAIVSAAAGLAIVGTGFGIMKLAGSNALLNMTSAGQALTVAMANVNAGLAAGTLHGQALSTALADVAAKGAAAQAAVAALRAGLLLLVGIPIAQAAGEWIGNKIYDMLTAQQRAINEEANRALAFAEARAAAETRIADRTNKGILRGFREQIAEKSRGYLEDIKNYQTALKITEEVTKESLDHIMQSRRKMTQELVRISEDAAKKAHEELPQQINDIRSGMADRRFQNQISSKDPDEQVRRLAMRSRDLADNAARMLASAQDTTQEKAADNEWRRAEALAKQTEEVAKQTNDTDLLRLAWRTLDDLDQKHIGSLEQQKVLQEQLSQQAKVRAKEAEDHNRELEENRKAIERTLKTTEADQKGGIKFKDKDTLEKDLKSADALISAFAKKLDDYGQQDFAKKFMGDPHAWEAMKRENERLIASSEVEQLQGMPDKVRAMYGQMQAEASKLRLEFPVIAKMEAATGKSLLDGFQELANGFEAQLATATARGISKGQAQGIINAEATVIREAAKQMGGGKLSTENAPRKASVAGPWGGPGDLTPQYGDTELNQRWLVNQAASQLDAVLQKGEVTEKQLTRIKSFFEGSTAIDFTQAGLSTAEQARIGKSLELLLAAVEKVKAAKDKLNDNKDVKSDAGLQEVNKEVDATNKKKVAEKAATDELTRGAEAAKSGTAAIQSQTGPTQSNVNAAGMLAGQWATVARNAWAAAQAIAAAASADSGGGGGGEDYEAFGGPIRYFDRGGYAPRGTDTIHAMLSPEEFVVNARASKRFFSQLVSMNAGIQPAYRAEGGQAGNVTIGDIHINEASEPRQTAREVIKSLKRELRRGTSAF